MERWNERVQSPWERFCYLLNNLTVMCTDSDKRKHCLYHDPVTDKWYVFFIGKNKMLVTILTEDIYSRQSNAVMLSPNKELYFNKAFTDQTFLAMNQSFQLTVHYNTGRNINYKCKWINIFPRWNCIDSYVIQYKFEQFCEKLVSTETFLRWLYNQVNIVNSNALILDICGKKQEIEYSIGE